MTFTDRQIKNWKLYEQVRQSGMYNMFDKRAMLSTGLEADEWLFCMKHYGDLKAHAEGAKQ